jgi:hypothetical protein
MEVWWWVVADRMVISRPTGIPADADPQASAGPAEPAPDQGATDPAGTPPERGGDARDAAPKPPKPSRTPPRPDPIVYAFDDGRSDIEDVLGPYLDRPVPLPAEILERWRTSGLRAIAVPREDLDALEQRLRLSGQVNRQWLGQVTAWADIAQGPWRPDRTTVKVEEQDVQLPPGRLRLSMRCWSIPPERESDSGVLRLELTPELEPYRTEQDRLLVAAGLAPARESAPAPFERLRLSATISTTDAILILPERIHADWTAPPQLQSPLGGPPPMPDNPSLGEAMLERPPGDLGARARAVLVLIPTPGDKFELLGR